MGLGDALKSSVKSEFFPILPWIWPLCSTLREKDGRYEDSKSLYPAPNLDQSLSTLFTEARGLDFCPFNSLPHFVPYAHPPWSTLATSLSPNLKNTKLFKFFATR